MERELRLLEEKDTNLLLSFVNKYIEITENKENTYEFLFENKFKALNLAALVRCQLYNHYDEYLAIIEEDSITNLVSLYLTEDYSKTLNIKFIYTQSHAVLLEMINYLHAKFNNLNFLKDVNKLRIEISIEGEYADYWIEKLIEIGFEKESLNTIENTIRLTYFLNDDKYMKEGEL